MFSIINQHCQIEGCLEYTSPGYSTMASKRRVDVNVSTMRGHVVLENVVCRSRT